MSIAAQTASAFVRAAIIAGGAVAVSARLDGMRGRMRWALLLAPFLTPPLLVSYAYSRYALALVVAPWSHHAAYAALLFLKLVPVALVVRWLMPSPLSAEARHCHRTLAAPSFFERAKFHLRDAGAWFAGGLVFLLAFADFEVASLWSIKTWTVALFDAQTGGMNLRETLRRAALPVGVQIAVLALLLRTTRSPVRTGSRRDPGGKFAFVYLAFAALVVCVLPLLVVAGQAVRGVPAITENFVLGNEIGVSVVFAFSAAAMAGGLVGATRALPGIPGLLGPLIVALLVLALFQTPPLRPLYDTPLPLLLALTIILLPLALLLRALLPMRPISPMRHIARQFGSRRLIWELEHRPHLAAFALLFCWAYFDFTASSILAPTGLTPVFVRLHNLAHYGQTAVLSAMMLAAFTTPALLLLLTLAAGRIYARRDDR